ncbi:MAG: flagellar basal body-associated FliL family protein [Deltaproteobacteria bacterium]|jgi:flagellar FliL protein|nr:flagellar basal body-associated FliL family protein [Deltaproteobacteria bacterium]MBW2449470.1 flagellar basal body-associated FliL family protein [Deltaproteobacteria bacterium]
MAEEKEEVKDAEKKETPKKSKLKLIIIGVVVLLVGVGGYFGYSSYRKGKQEKADANKTEKVSIICPLKAFVVNLLDHKGVGKRYLKVTIQLEVEKEEHKMLIENHIPQLRDTILLLLSSQTLKEINTMEGKLELKQALLSRMKQILGDGIVRRIYFTEFVVQ